MKKIMVLVAALLLVAPLSAMAGMTAFMDMDEMSDNELAETKGQTGITIRQHLEISGGYIAWGDNDGCGGTSANQGWLTLNNITVSGLDANVDIDVCHAGGEDTTWLTITINEQIINANIEDIKVGSLRNIGASLGELTINNLRIASTTMEITGH